MIGYLTSLGSSNIENNTFSPFNNKNPLSLVNTIVNDTSNQDFVLWKFWLFYFLMKNRQIEKNHISEVQSYLSNFDIESRNLQGLDESITTFIIGYRVLSEVSKSHQYHEKSLLVFKELEDHWSDKKRLYFNNDLYTLLILFCSQYEHDFNKVIEEYEDTNNYSRLALIFLILDKLNEKDTMRNIYANLVRKIKTKSHELRDYDKVFIFWLLWKYRFLSSSTVKYVREELSVNNNFFNNRLFDQSKEAILNFETAFLYDLIYTFEKESRLSFDEVPFIFRLLGGIFGFSLIAISGLIGYFLRLHGYLNQSNFFSFDAFVNFFIVMILGFFAYVGAFFIYEVGYEGICANEEIKTGLKDWIVAKYFYAFLIGVVAFGYLIQLI